MGGIRLRNLFERGALRSAFDFGLDVWLPPNDEQYVVATTSLADNTADGAFTLNSSGIGAHANRLLWPCRLFVVLRNRGAITAGAPGITQVNPSFAGNDQFLVTIVGKFMGRVVSETLTVNVAAITNPSGAQRSHMVTTNHYDEITSVSHSTKTGAWGQTTPLQVSVGTGNCEIGDPSQNRNELRYPFPCADTARLKRFVYPWDNTSVGIGTGTTNATINNSTKSLSVPGKAADFREFKAFTGQVLNTLTSTAHGLTEGQVVQVGDIGDNLGGLSARTNYYVANAQANTISLATSRTIQTFLTSETADTLTKTAHGLANTQPVLIYDIGNGIPTGLAAATIYYVVNTAANTIQLATTSGGAAINITSGGDNPPNGVNIGILPIVDINAALLFADNDPIMVLRPFQAWRTGRLLIDGGAAAEGVS